MARIDLPILFSQTDSRWSQILLGFNTQAIYNFFNYACLITCLAMVAKYYNKDTDPVGINNALKALGVGVGFGAGSGNYVGGAFNKLYSDIQEIRTLTPAKMTDAQIGEIKTALDKGFPVMVGLDYNPKTVAYDSHFVLLVDYDPTDENNFTIADPLGGKTHSLKDYLGWYKPSARNTIEQYVIFQGKVPQINSNNILVGKDQWELMRLNHDKWHQFVHYIDPNLDPNTTPEEQIQSVIAGYKSRSTDMENKANQANSDLAVANQEINNRKEQVSRLEQQVLDMDKAKTAEIKALKASIPDSSEVERLYKGQIAELQGKVDQAMKDKGIAQNELASCKAGLKTDSLIQKLINILTGKRP